MSCFVMSPNAIRSLANVLDTALNFFASGRDVTILSAAVCDTTLTSAFADCMYGRSYSGEMIADALYALNVKAYSARYNETISPKLPRRVPGQPLVTLYDMPVIQDYMERPQEWHYQLAALLDCWLYQTDEAPTRSDPKCIALLEFSRNLKSEIVTHSMQYSLRRWC